MITVRAINRHPHNALSLVDSWFILRT